MQLHTLAVKVCGTQLDCVHLSGVNLSHSMFVLIGGISCFQAASI